MVRRVVLAASCVIFLEACEKKAMVPKEPASAPAENAAPAELELTDEKGKHTKLSLEQILALAPGRIVETRDDQYGKKKRFNAFSLGALLDKTIGREGVRSNEILLKALDGYVVSIAGSRLYDGEAYIAFDDMDAPGFAPIGPKLVNPGPFYLVWLRDEQHDLVQWPRPYQLVSIGIGSYSARFPHTIPSDGDALVTHGFSIFKSLCVHCHAMNREGGHVGPELNVPKNVLEYWSEENLRVYIKNPQAFRYGNMPPNPQLDAHDIDGLLAYLRHMQSKKHDVQP
jgi:cytochrome c2